MTRPKQLNDSSLGLSSLSSQARIERLRIRMLHDTEAFLNVRLSKGRVADWPITNPTTPLPRDNSKRGDDWAVIPFPDLTVQNSPFTIT